MGDWTVILVSFTSNGLKRRDCINCDHYETLETEPSKNYTLSFGTNGTYHSTSVDAIDLSHVQIGDNAGNNAQVKNGYITVTLKADGILTINGYNGYTVYSISDGTTTEVVTDSTYRYVATEDVTLTIVADPDGTGNNYFLSLDINYPVIVNENTALDLSATGAHIERTTGTYEFLYIDATSGKFADNNGGWVQVNTGTIITLYVRDRAEVLLNAYNSVDNFEISIVDGVCTIKVVGNDYINSITINYPVVVEENTLIDLSATGANIQGGKGTYGPLYVNATSGKFADNNSGWVQVNAGTIITINVLDGARVYIKAYTSVENFEISIVDGVCTITVKANDYLKSILVEYEHSYNEGVVTAPTCKAEGYTTYTCELCGHSYTGDVTEKAAHTPGEIVKENETAPTCTVDGSHDEVTYCTVCNAETSRETVEVPAAGHSGGTATCTAKAICEVCGNEYGETAEHSLSNGVCIFGCGYKKVVGGWQLVTDVNQLTVGSEIVIVGNKVNNAISTEQKSNNRAAVAITRNDDGTITINDNVQIITLQAGKSEGTFAFYTGTAGYLYAASSGSNHLKTKTTLDDHGSWTITITNGVASIIATNSTNRNVMQYNPNNGSPLFACYATASQTALQIYVKVEGFDCEPHIHYGGQANCSSPAVCEYCGEKYGEIGGHISAGAATCEVAETCSVCNTTLTPATGHNMADATCTVPSTCQNGCGLTTGEALGHTWGDWEVTKEATETEDGSQHRFCSACNEEEIDVINRLDHVHSYQSVVTAPTCTTAGYTTYTCSCDDSYVADEVEALGHKDENSDFKCEKCGVILAPEADSTLTIAQAVALGKLYEHNTFTENKYYITGTVDSVSSTTYGNMTIKDSAGNSIYIYGLYNTAGVRYDSLTYKPIKGDTITVYTIIGYYNTSPQLKEAQMTNVTIHGENHVWDKEASCTEAPVCTICDVVGQMLDHNYEDGECTACGKADPNAGGTVEPTWQKATSIAVGDVVTLVCESKKMELSAISTTSTKYGIGVAYTSAPAGVMKLTVVAGSSSGTYAFKTADGKYLYWTSGNSLNVSTTLNANTSWTVTFSGGNVVIKNAKDSSRQIYWNASSPRFACYSKSGQQAIQLYVYK